MLKLGGRSRLSLSSATHCLGEPGQLIPFPTPGLWVRIRFLLRPFDFNALDSEISPDPNHRPVRDVCRNATYFIARKTKPNEEK